MKLREFKGILNDRVGQISNSVEPTSRNEYINENFTLLNDSLVRHQSTIRNMKFKKPKSLPKMTSKHKQYKTSSKRSNK